MVKVKRVYAPLDPKDGYRVLVDRLWPRGLKKTDLALDEWCRELAPSTDLRKWFNHEVEKWPDFKKKYQAELKAPVAVEILKKLKAKSKRGTVTLLYSAHDEEHNQAVVLQDYLRQ